MKKIIIIVGVLLSVFFLGCTEDEKIDIEEENILEIDIVNEVIDERAKKISSYLSESSILNEFDVTNQSVISNSSNKKASIKALMFESKTNPNKKLVIKEDIDGTILSAQLCYVSNNDTVLTTSFYSLEGKYLFNINVDIETHRIIISENTKRAFSLCNASMFAASIPWTVGFGMVNPLAGLAAGAVFWGLEHYVCQDDYDNLID